MRPILSSVLLAFFCLLLAAPCAVAQDKAKAKPEERPATQALPDTPQKKDEHGPKKTPVAVDHDETDPVGGRMVYHLKELLGRSSLMALTTRDEKKIVLAIKTREEFPGRPATASVFAVSWLYQAKEGSLKYFLTSEVGVVDAATLEQTVEAILLKTDKLAGTYAYLFE